MKKEDNKKTRVEVDTQTLRKLNILKANKGHKSLLQTIQYLLQKEDVKK